MSYTNAELEKFNRLKLSVMASADEWKGRQTGHGTYADYIDSVEQRHPGSTQVRHFRELDRKSRLYGLPGLGEVKAANPVQQHTNRNPISTAQPVTAQTRTTPPKVTTTRATTSTTNRPAPNQASAQKPQSIKPMTDQQKQDNEVYFLSDEEKRIYSSISLLTKSHDQAMTKVREYRDHISRFGASGRGELLEA